MTSRLSLPFIFIFIILTSSSYAEDILVNLKAKNLKYDEERKLITATQSVEARIRDLLVKADIMYVDVATKVATAEGNVIIMKDEYYADCTYLTYDVSEEVAYLYHFSSILTPPEIKGKLFIKSETVQDRREYKSGREGASTTCDYEEPHYSVTAKTFVYYPGDKFVGFSCTFYIGRIPVFWVPVWIFNLKSRKASPMPIIGHNEVEGDFIKSAFDYFINPDASGTLYLDQMSKKGVGIGVGHDYRISKKQDGTFYVYHVYEKDTGKDDWVTKINHNIKLDKNTNLNLFHNYSNIYLIPYGRADMTNSKFDLSHKSDLRKFNIGFNMLDDRYGFYEKYDFRLDHSYNKFDTSYLLSTTSGKKYPVWRRMQQRLSHSQPLISQKWTLSTVINYYKNTPDETKPSDELLEPQLDIVDREDLYTLRVFSNWHIDLDCDLYKGDEGDRYLERLPEVTLTLKPYEFPIFSLSPEFAYAKFHEAEYVPQISKVRHFTGDRYKMSLTANKTLPLVLGTTLNLMSGIDQFAYDAGDQRYAYRERIGVGTELWGFFRNGIDYNRGISEGNTPFFFDNYGNNYQNVKETATFYYLDKITWINDCGYNFQIKKYYDYTTRLAIMPSDRFYLNMSSGYSIENKCYLDLVNSLRVIPLKGYATATADFSSSHDLNNGTLRSASDLIDLQVGEDWFEKWHFRVGHVYDFFTKQYLMREFMVVKDLHCWEVKVTYSDYKKEYRLVFTLKAFPEQPIGWATYEGFYFEGFSRTDILKESPRRY